MSVSRGHALTGRTIVCLSTIDWDFLWQGHQEIMSRFARAGNRVVFVENTGVRSVRPSDLSRIIGRLRRAFERRQRQGRLLADGVTVIAPLVLPFPRSAFARFVNDHILLPRLARSIQRLTDDRPVIFTYLPTRTARRLIDLIRGPRSVVVYYCVADFTELSDSADISANERELVMSSDLVFVQGPEFARRFAGLNDRIHEFRAGVNTDVFDPDAVGPMPEELLSLPRPLVGYSGGLHRHVDFDLIARVARSVRQGSVILAGPIQADASGLRSEPNVHFLGSRRPRDLAAVVAQFDVGLIPYLRSAYTETVYPTKLLEYLAVGRPAVSTDLPEVRRLGFPPSAVRIADGPDQFVRYVQDALVGDTRVLASERRRIAQERDWSSVVDAMAELIAAEVARREIASPTMTRHRARNGRDQHA